jgi:hypothetical protein
MNADSRPLLPNVRGPLTEAVRRALLEDERGGLRAAAMLVDDLDVLTDDDAQLALACCYELYQSFAGVDATSRSRASTIAGSGIRSSSCCEPDSNEDSPTASKVRSGRLTHCRRRRSCRTCVSSRPPFPGHPFPRS